MRAILLLVAVAACITTGKEAGGQGVINKLLQGLVIKIPDMTIGKTKLTHIELSELELNDLNISQSLAPDDRSGLVFLNTSIAFKLHLDVRELFEARLGITFPNAGPLVASFNLSNPNETIKQGDAIQAEMLDLEINAGSFECHVTWGILPVGKICDDLVKTGLKYVNDHKTEIMNSISTDLTSMMAKLAKNATSHVVPNPWEVATTLEEPFTSPDFIEFKNNTAFKAVQFIVNDIYGAVDATGNTALGQAVSYYTVAPLKTNITLINKSGNIVTLQEFILRNVNISSLILIPVEKHSMMLSMTISNASIDVLSNVTLNNVDHTYVFNQEVNATLENVVMDLNISFMVAANGTMYGELPLGSLFDPPAVMAFDDLMQWVSNQTIECWGQYPIHGSNVSTLNVNLYNYDLNTNLISEDVSRDADNLFKIFMDFLPNSMNALIHGVLNETLPVINDAMHVYPHIEGPNPCADTSHTSPPVSSFNYSSSKLIKAIDILVNDVVGTTGSWGINGWFHAIFSQFHLDKHIAIHAPKYVGNITLDVNNMHYVGHPVVTDMQLLIPNETSKLDNYIEVENMNISMVIYYKITGADQTDFYDNFTLAFSADSFIFQDVLDIVIQPERLLSKPIKDFSIAGCITAMFDYLGSPYTLAKIKNFGVGLSCNDCQSNQYPEAEQTLHNPTGVQQMNEGVQWLLDQINHILTNNVTKDYIAKKLVTARIECDDNITPAPVDHHEDTGGVMTNTKAYLTIFLFSGGIFLILMVGTPILYYKRKKEIFVEEGVILMSKPEHYPLVLHPALPAWFRWGVVFILFGTVALFLTSNTPPQGVGAVVRARLWLAGSLIKINNLFTYALANTIRDMWNGAVYPLSIIVLVFSGMWPYTKMAILIWAWCVPPCVVSPATRGKILQAVDFLGKWSLIDSFMVVMMMVAFRMHILLPPDQQYLPPKFFVLDVVVTPYWGLFGFMTAAIMALVINHIMVMANRHCIDYDESGGKSGGWFEDASAKFSDERVKLCLHCDEDEDKNKMWWRSAGVVGLLVLSLSLLIAGVSVNIFTFEIEGLAAWALNLQGAGTSQSEYSIIGLANGVMSQAPLTNLLGEYLYLVIGFMLFTVVLPIAQILALLSLWLLPLTLKEQKMLFVANEVIAAWCCLEVFIVVLIAVLMEIGKFAGFLIGNSCIPINAAMANILHPLGYMTDVDDTCFTVKAVLVEGCWILFAAAIASNVAYLVAWKYAEHLIESRHASQVARCPYKALLSVQKNVEGDDDVKDEDSADSPVNINGNGKVDVCSAE
eukprot:TRINITY_DN4040_c0_g1_i1.p1 TRINITY_DN4040_c0_g1~~TRINITY_DN4040_c0_g1_i1.p1  ORF type:complete len:1313 (+),score=263.84 TRINITY_DN4040_c0_g1_i1:87-3941(+)